jgi:hypothetical protein
MALTRCPPNVVTGPLPWPGGTECPDLGGTTGSTEQPLGVQIGGSVSALLSPRLLLRVMPSSEQAEADLLVGLECG